jgi:mono/diheme cytochrome c family protein
MPCHGDAGQGGPGGGMPFTDALTVDSIAAILRTGRNNMPEFGSVYTVEDIDSIAHFVVEKLIRK